MKRQPYAGQQQGSALLEALVAIVIFSAGIICMLMLQAAATRQVTDSKYRLEASFIANQVLGDLWAHRTQLADSDAQEQALDSLPNGKRTVTVKDGQVTITISWQVPGEAQAHHYDAVALIKG